MLSLVAPHESIDQLHNFIRLSDRANVHGATSAF
jgi:hypothetical protein